MDNLVIDEETNISVNHEDSNNITGYQCNDCKCSFLALKEDIDKCIYCGSSNIVKNNNSIDNAKIVPFTVKVEEAQKEFKKITKFNPLIPLKVKSKKNLENIKKVYFLVYKVDASMNGSVTFNSTDKTKSKEIPKKYESVLDVNIDYTNSLINTNKKITSREFIKSFPSDLPSLQDYKESLLTDEIIICSDYTDEELSRIVSEKIVKNSLNIVAGSVSHDNKELKENSTSTKIDYMQPVLIPMYFLNTRYKNKDYHYLYNGVNKSVYYKFPLGIIETIIFGIIVFGLVFLIGYLIAMAL
jgi:DNA-directed RNA polymerase subunit RPC12/RpoP